MLIMDMMQIAMLGGGVLTFLLLILFAFAGPSGSAAKAKRLDKVRFRHSESTNAKMEAQMKKAVSARKKNHRPAGANQSRLDTLAIRLDRTGRTWSISQYFYVCGGLFALVSFALLIKGAPLLLCIFAGTAIGVGFPHMAVGFFINQLGNKFTVSFALRIKVPPLRWWIFAGTAIGLGFPHMAVGFLISKRVNKFTASFPDAIELLVRGLRSGLPVTETIGVVAREVSGPVGEEFSKVVDRIKIGRTMEDALGESAKRLDTPEFKFFCFTLAIQRETGGNLAETLANRAAVLPE